MIRDTLFRFALRAILFQVFTGMTMVSYASDQSLCLGGSGRSAFQACLRLAQQGMRAAQYNVSLMYYQGNGTSIDKAQGAYWMRKSAELGFVEAQMMAGGIYAQADGVPKDETQAAYWFLKAAEQGHRDAQYNIGLRFAQGSGVAKDDSQAVFWFRKSAEQGQPSAQLNLGQRLRKGIGTTRNEVEGVQWIRRAAEQGDGTAQKVLGLLYIEGEDVSKDANQGLYWLRKAVEKNDPKAQRMLALVLLKGDGFPRDAAQAFGWLVKAAEAGDRNGQYHLAELYVHGDGTATNPQKAFEWMRKSAQQGFGLARKALAEMYLAGIGTAMDPAIARGLFEQDWKASASSSAGLQQDLSLQELEKFSSTGEKLRAAVARRDYARLLELGIGGPVDQDLARKLYTEMMALHSGVVIDSPLMGWAAHEQKLDIGPASSDRSALMARLTGNCRTRPGEPAEFFPASARNSKLTHEIDLAVLVDPKSGIDFSHIATVFDGAAEILSTCGIRIRKVLQRYIDTPGQDGCANMNALDSSPLFPLVSVSASRDGSTRSPFGGHANRMSRGIVYGLSPNFLGPRDTSIGVAHELGHVLGLAHPTHFRPNAMQYGMLDAPFFDEEQCSLALKSPLLVPIMGAKLALGRSPEDYFPKRNRRSWIDAMSQKNMEVAIFYELAALNAFSSEEWIGSTSTFRFLATKYGLPIERVLKIYEYAHNWRGDQVLPDENTKFDFSMSPYLPWLPEESLKVDFDSVATRKSTEDMYSKIAMKAISDAANPSLPPATSNRRRGDKVSLVRGMGVSNFRTTMTDKAPVSLQMMLSLPQNELLILYPRNSDDYVFIDSLPGFLNLYDRGNLEEVRRHWSYPKSVETAPPTLADPQSKVQPTGELKKSGYGDETPASIPGAKVITSVGAWQAIQKGLQDPGKKVVVLSAIEEKLGLPTARNVNFAAPGTSLDKNDAIQAKLAAKISGIATGSGQMIIVYCHSANCWLSYNVALRLQALGYKNVHWLRDGIVGWTKEKLPLGYVADS